jgi:hypothetical protein
MKFRDLIEADIPELAKIQSDHPDFAALNIKKFVVDGVVTDDEIVKAYGIVLPLAEAVFLPSQDNTVRETVEALLILLNVAIKSTKKSGISQLHCFIRNPSFAEIMKKHYGFKPCEGEALVLDL